MLQPSGHRHRPCVAGNFRAAAVLGSLGEGRDELSKMAEVVRSSFWFILDLFVICMLGAVSTCSADF